MKRERSEAASPSTAKRTRLNSDPVVQEITDPVIVQHRLPFKDGDVIYVEAFLPTKHDSWYQQLLDDIPWYTPTLTMYGRSFQQSRQIAAYAKKDMELKYSGTTVKMHTEYPPVLQEIQDLVEAKTGATFNHVMLNRYDDGSVYIGKHRDNKENKVIASISLGAERDFIMTHDKHTKGKDIIEGEIMKKRWPLKDGSLLIMQGETQAHWKHEIPKQLKIKKGRISLTFRQYF